MMDFYQDGENEVQEVDQNNEQFEQENENELNNHEQVSNELDQQIILFGFFDVDFQRFGYSFEIQNQTDQYYDCYICINCAINAYIIIGILCYYSIDMLCILY